MSKKTLLDTRKAEVMEKLKLFLRSPSNWRREALLDRLDEYHDQWVVQSRPIDYEAGPDNKRGRKWFGNDGIDCRTSGLCAA